MEFPVLKDNIKLTVKDVAAGDFIQAYAEQLKKSNKIRVPEWTELVKTAHFKEMAPYDADWLYVRAAALARKVYLRQNLGLSAFKKFYGGKANFGTSREHFRTASGKIIRYCLQELERNGVVERDSEKGGRRITKNGQQELDLIARELGNKA